jgi:hypothetical protein
MMLSYQHDGGIQISVLLLKKQGKISAFIFFFGEPFGDVAWYLENHLLSVRQIWIWCEIFARVLLEVKFVNIL